MGETSFTNNKERVPLEHYKKIYGKLDPSEVSKRCCVPYDGENHGFRMRLMGEEYYFRFPDFEMLDSKGAPVQESPVKILLIRYFINGSHFEPTGKQLTYRDVPGGELYYPNFLGRCIKRLAFKFGRDLDKFSAAMEKIGAERVQMGDCAYRFEFISGLCMTFILWSGDDELPPSAQILFDNNFPFAFTAEDIAVVGDVSIAALGK
jgi:hypothetical protein